MEQVAAFVTIVNTTRLDPIAKHVELDSTGIRPNLLMILKLVCVSVISTNSQVCVLHSENNILYSLSLSLFFSYLYL